MLSRAKKSNSTVVQVHAINTLLNSVKAIKAMKVLFNTVAVLLVSQITSPARPRTCLAKAKDFCSRPRPRTQNLSSRTSQGQGPRPRTTTFMPKYPLGRHTFPHNGEVAKYLNFKYRHRDHIGWNHTLKIISRPTSLRHLLTLTPTWAIWCKNHGGICTEIYGCIARSSLR